MSLALVHHAKHGFIESRDALRVALARHGYLDSVQPGGEALAREFHPTVEARLQSPLRCGSRFADRPGARTPASNRHDLGRVVRRLAIRT